MQIAWEKLTAEEQASLLRTTGTGVWSYEPASATLHLDARAAELTGVGPGAATGVTLAGWLAAVDPDRREAVAALVREGDPWAARHGIEFDFVRPDGEWRALELRAYAAATAAEPSRRRLGTLVDVSERRHGRALLEIEARFSAILVDSPDRTTLQSAILDAALGLPEFDAGGLYWRRADGGYDLVCHRGLSEDFLAATGSLAADAPQSALVRAGTMICSFDAGPGTHSDPGIAERPYMRREGLTAAVALPIAVAGEHIACLNLASRDVQRLPMSMVRMLGRFARRFGRALESVQAREQRVALRENLAGLFAAIDDFVFIVGVDGNIVHVNDAVRTRLGHTEAILGQSVLALHPARVHDQATAVIADLAAGRTTECPLPLLRADGTEVPVETRVVAGRWNGEPALFGISRDISSRHRMEEALLRERSFLKTLVQTIPDLIWLKDPDGVYLSCNRQFEALYGAPEAEIVGRTDTDFVDAELAAFFRANDLAAMAAGGPRRNEEWLTLADGRRGLYETTKTPMVDPDGTVVGVLGIAHEITAARQAEEALRESEAKLRRVLDNAGDAVFVADAAGRYVYANQQAGRLLGYEKGELLGCDAATVTMDNFVAVAAGEPLKREIGLKRKDGGVVPVELVAVRLPDETVLHVCRDITRRRRAEAELARHREHLEELVRERTAELEKLNHVLQVSDLRLKAVFDMSQRANEMDERDLLQQGIEEAVRLTGSEIGYLHLVNDDQETLELYTWSAATLAHCTAAHDNHYPIAVAGVWADTARTRRPVVHNDYQALSGRQGYPAGHAHLVRHLGVPVVEKDKVRVLLGVGNKPSDYDDSDVRELQLIGEDLWRIVMRRRAEAALAVARDEAEQANRAKSTFLASMSHEIRTPMNAIIGLAHLARREARDAEQGDRLDKISGAAQHLLGVINDVLDLAQIEAGRLTLEATEVELERVFETVNTLLAEKAAAKGLELVYAFDARLACTLVGDGLRLGQILLNLAGNAVKFTDRGAIVLRARVVDESPGKLRVRFEVADAGAGIAPTAIARLFKPFAQVDDSATRRHGGTGLGLAISRHLVELMSGTIGVESEEGKGSTFWFEVPFARAASPAAVPAAGPARRVLLVEPRPEARTAIRDMLEALGHAVESLPSLAGAADLLTAAERAGAPFCCVLLGGAPRDAETTGAIARLAALPLASPPHLVVLAPGGMAATDVPRGASGVLHKPVTLSALRAALERTELPRRSPDAPTAVGHDTAAALRGKRVLLVEDNPINLEVAGELLREFGVDVVSAENGAIAIEWAARQRFDLVLMDLQMPELDGLAATRALRQLPGWTAVPILALTANVFTEDRERCFAAGMNDFVAKPVDPAKLQAVLQRWLVAETRAEPAAVPAIPSGIGPFAAVDGMDARAGLAAVRNNTAAYRRLLRQYLDIHGDDMTRLADALAAGDRDEARRIVHSLKGAAAVLGLRAVQEPAAELEARIRGGTPAAELAANIDLVRGQQARLAAALEVALAAAG